jgi:hypothetical protein
MPDYIRHVKKSHKGVIEVAIFNKPGIEEFQRCEECSNIFIGSRGLKIHQSTSQSCSRSGINSGEEGGQSGALRPINRQNIEEPQENSSVEDDAEEEGPRREVEGARAAEGEGEEEEEGGGNNRAPREEIRQVRTAATRNRRESISRVRPSTTRGRRGGGGRGGSARVGRGGRGGILGQQERDVTDENADREEEGRNIEDGHLQQQQHQDQGVLSMEELKDLAMKFGKALFYVSSKWRKQLSKITFHLMGKITEASIEEDEFKVQYVLTSLLILPGLISEIRVSKVRPVISFLSETAGAADKAGAIISMAQRHLRTAGTGEDHRPTAARFRGEKTITRKALAERVDSLAKDGRLSSATRTLSEMAVMVEAGNESKIRVEADHQTKLDTISNLHPRASEEHDNFIPEALEILQQQEEEEGINISSFSVTAEHVLGAVKNLSTGASPGFSGWTFSAIQAIILPLDNQLQSCAIIAEFFNLILSGRFKNKLLTTTRSILIEKGNGEFRPLGIGETWYRFLARMVSKLIGIEVGGKLEPLQLGCGISGGCEIAGRLGQIILDSDRDMCAIKLDLQNAFNSMRRKVMWKGIQEFAPELIHWYMWAYGEESELRLSNGELVGTSATGCRQGDPLSPLCFSVGLQAALKDIEAMVKEVCRRDDVELSCGTIAYMDDTTIFVPRRFVNEVGERIAPILEFYGLRLSVHKCSILGGRVNLIEDPIFKVSSQGEVIMGVPTGDIQYRKDQVEDMISKMIQPLGAIHLVDQKNSFNILRSCINARPCYLARVCDPPIVEEGLKRFDSAVDSAILRLTKAVGDGDLIIRPQQMGESFKNSSILRSLPTALGGLGIVRHAGIVNEKASEKSRQLTKKFINKFLPFLLPGTELWDIFINYNGARNLESEILPLMFDSTPPDFLQNSQEQQQPQQIQQDDDDNELQQQQPISSKAIILAFHKRVAQNLHLKLFSQENKRAEAAWLISSQYKNSGRWLAGRNNIFYGKFGLLGDDFLEALRLRLLLPPLLDDDLEINPRKCLCEHICSATKPFHLLDCKLSKAYITGRHNKIRDLLFQFIKDCLPEGSVIQKEIPFQVTTTTMITADIQYETNNNIHYIDVAVANPSSQTYLNLGSATTADVATKHKEQAKSRHYEVLGNAVQTGRFIPFALEATGRLGPAAVRFIERMAGLRYDLKNKLIDQINVVMAHFNGQLIFNRREQLVLIPPPPLSIPFLEEDND